MHLNFRKLGIALVVLGILGVLYMIYARLGGTDPASLQVPQPMPIPVSAPRPVREPNDSSGKFDDVQVDGVQNTRFVHRGPDGRVDREFGFETFLHKQGDRWGFTEPYLKLFLNKFECRVTADTGEGQVQTSFGQPTLDDALFRGHVVIHIIPPEPGDWRECFIYLDDVTFVAEKSLFSTAGPVRFVSRSAMLDGTGMELIYDGIRGRLELFRIVDMGDLRFRSADMALLSDKQGSSPDDSPAGGGEIAAPTETPTKRDASASRRDRGPGDYYRCVLRRNVTIETPEERVVIQEAVSINNLFWARSQKSSPNKPADGQAAEPNHVDTPGTPTPETPATIASSSFVFSTPPVELFDIVVTCDGGCVVAPVDSRIRVEDPNEVVPAAAREPEQPKRAAGSDKVGRDIPRVVTGRRFDYDAITGDADFAGPVQITAKLDPNNLFAGLAGGSSKTATGLSPSKPGPGGKPVPMTITAGDAVHYCSALDQVTLRGDCVAVAEQTDSNSVNTILLSAPVFVLDLAEDANATALEKAVEIKRFSTEGGPALVRASMHAASASAGPKSEAPLLGETSVLASQLVYEAVPPLFTARGPGAELRFYNGQPAKPKRPAESGKRRPMEAAAAGMAFNQPGYGLLWNFDLLTFAPDANRMVVSADPGPILFGYAPVADVSPAGLAQMKRPDQDISGDMGHLDLTLRKDLSGQTKVAGAVVSGGIAYEDQGQTRRFAGDKLVYDGDQGVIRITGSEGRPCKVNDALVDQIEINADTGAFKAEVRGPGTFQSTSKP